MDDGKKLRCQGLAPSRATGYDVRTRVRRCVHIAAVVTNARTSTHTHAQTQVHAQVCSLSGSCHSCTQAKLMWPGRKPRKGIARSCRHLHGGGEVYHDHDDDDEEEDGVTHTQFETR